MKQHTCGLAQVVKSVCVCVMPKILGLSLKFVNYI